MIENEIEEGGFTGFIPGLEIAARLAALKGKYDMAAQLYFNARILRKTLGTPIIKSEAYIYHTFLSDLKNNLSEEKINLAETRRMNDSQLLKLLNHVLNLF